MLCVIDKRLYFLQHLSRYEGTLLYIYRYLKGESLMTVKKMIISLLKGTKRFENHDEYFRARAYMCTIQYVLFMYHLKISIPIFERRNFFNFTKSVKLLNHFLITSSRHILMGKPSTYKLEQVCLQTLPTS